jgi:hypothetical protein
MTVKHNSLYLFLALACFAGIILIFIFDGYIGVYDNLVMDNGQYKQTVEYDQWAREEKFGGYVGIGVDQGGQIDFTYTVENHRFSAYTDRVVISLWSNKVKTADILSEDISVPAFGKKALSWTIKAGDILPAGYAAGQSYFVTVNIKSNNIERNINVNTNTYPATGGKVIPVPAPQ